MTIAIIDFETDGLEPETSAVIEVGITEISLPDRGVSAPKSWLCGSPYKMTPENRAVHHINPATLLGKTPFDPDALNDEAEANSITCWAAHNASFEMRFWTPRLPIICTYKSALRAWPDAPGHSNSVLRYWLEDQGRQHGFNYAHAQAHRAGPDSYVTAWTLKALLEDGHTGKTLLQWSKEPAILPRCPMGKYKNLPWSACDRGWLTWCVGNKDIGEDIRFNAQRELDAR